MTDLELKTLKDNLWHAADVLRSGAHLAANKYGQPILGLIFLRYADILYKQHKAEIDKEYELLKGTRRERSLQDISIEKCGFYYNGRLEKFKALYDGRVVDADFYSMTREDYERMTR